MAGSIDRDSDQQEARLPGVPRVVAAVPPRFPFTGVWAIRHGESLANQVFADPNLDRPMTGSDAAVPLSSTGYEQAVGLGHWLAGRGPSHRPHLVLCSPYVRAVDTWTVMARTAYTLNPDAGSIPTRIDERLRDREMGIFELHPPAAVRRRDPREAARRKTVGEWAYRPPGGESGADVVLRVRDLLRDAKGDIGERRILIVAHDSIVAAIGFVFAGAAAPYPQQPPVPNASISHWQTSHGTLSCDSWADVSHLATRQERNHP